jgi:parallel beta-helix repeat protein
MVDLGDGHGILFQQILQAGNTELLISEEGPAPPEGYEMIPVTVPFYFNISTTAQYEDTIQVTLSFDQTGTEDLDESQFNLFVYNTEGEQWDSITLEVDTIGNKISGLVTHLTTFAIMFSSGPEGSNGYVVSNTLDSGEGSLRQVLSDAYLDTGMIVVTFQIPKTDPGFNADTGVWTIKPQSKLQSISDKHIIIDGTSQSQFIGEDTNPYGPEIEINGESAGEIASGLFFYNSIVEISHLIINRFSSAGIELWNVHHANIAGCYIGTGSAGWNEAGNSYGIVAYGNCKHINIVPLDTIPNVISGNDNSGISFEDTCSHCLVAGNIIGLSRNHREVVGGSSGYGISFLRCDSNTVVDNWIGGNGDGIIIWEGSGNLIEHNRIGTDAEWAYDIMNTGNGIYIGLESKHNKIVGNFIGNNSLDGIRILGNQAMYNTISENSISMNESKGINLVNGANGGIAAPKITNVNGNEIFGTAPPMSIIEIFTDEYDEGRIMQDVVWSDSAGNFSWPGPIEGPFDSIRATATDTLGNTSEFGLYRPGEDPSSVADRRDPIPFTLSNNYPGHYHPIIQVRFELLVNMDVNLDVYNLSGVKVYEIHKGKLQAGYHYMTWNTSQHAAGIYLIRMQTHRGALTRKCVVLK